MHFKEGKKITIIALKCKQNALMNNFINFNHNIIPNMQCRHRNNDGGIKAIFLVRVMLELCKPDEMVTNALSTIVCIYI
jgi:hypothetical protein